MRKLLILIFCCAAALGCYTPAPESYDDKLPYTRSSQKAYESKIMYSVFLPFMYEGSFFSFYALGRKISGPDSKGFYEGEFTNGSKAGEYIKTKNVITKVRPAEARDLKKGMVVLVNHWDPRLHNDDTQVDVWRKGVVHNLEKIKENIVMLEFPYDRNDFMATKEVYGLANIWIILEPKQTDPRIFL